MAADANNFFLRIFWLPGLGAAITSAPGMRASKTPIHNGRGGSRSRSRRSPGVARPDPRGPANGVVRTLRG